MPTKKITRKTIKKATRKTVKKTARTSRRPRPYQPIVLETWFAFGAPTRLVVLKDGELGVQYHAADGLWIPDVVPGLSIDLMAVA